MTGLWVWAAAPLAVCAGCIITRAHRLNSPVPINQTRFEFIRGLPGFLRIYAITVRNLPPSAGKHRLCRGTANRLYSGKTAGDPIMRVSRIAAGAAISFVTAGLTFGTSAAALAPNQQYSAANIQAGYRLYSAQCAVCHGGNGDAIAGVSLARQQFRRASTDADIRNTVTNGVPAAGMPPFQFRTNELDAVVAYIRSGFDISGTSFTVGDVGRGKAIYDGKGGCAACHRVRGNGSLAAPDL